MTHDKTRMAGEVVQRDDAVRNADLSWTDMFIIITSFVAVSE